jgi:hypothetical protein
VARLLYGAVIIGILLLLLPSIVFAQDTKMSSAQAGINAANIASNFASSNSSFRYSANIGSHSVGSNYQGHEVTVPNPIMSSATNVSNEVFPSSNETVFATSNKTEAIRLTGNKTMVSIVNNYSIYNIYNTYNVYNIRNVYEDNTQESQTAKNMAVKGENLQKEDHSTIDEPAPESNNGASPSKPGTSIPAVAIDPEGYLGK